MTPGEDGPAEGALEKLSEGTERLGEVEGALDRDKAAMGKLQDAERMDSAVKEVARAEAADEKAEREDRPDQEAHDKLRQDSMGSEEDQRRTRLLQRVQSDFTYYRPKPGQTEKYIDLRQRALELARAMVMHCPNSRELSTALTFLEGAVMHANASIARHG